MPNRTITTIICAIGTFATLAVLSALGGGWWIVPAMIVNVAIWIAGAEYDRRRP